jgi:hypothetical protein
MPNEKAPAQVTGLRSGEPAFGAVEHRTRV